MANDGDFASCADVGDSDHIWCWETEEGDYSQVFLVIGLGYAIGSGIFLLAFGAFLSGIVSLSSITLPREYNSWNRNTRPIYNYGTATGTACIKTLFFLLYLIIGLIYFIIKVYIVTLASPHYLWTINEEYWNKDFWEFLNARVILLLSLLALNTQQFWQINRSWFNNTLYDKFLGPLSTPCSCLLISVNGFFIFIVLCIYYPLLLICLYMLAISLLVVCMICCIGWPVLCYVACCMEACFLCFLSCFMVIEIGDSINISIGRTARFFAGLVFVILHIGTLYLISSISLCFMWLFLGGPPKSVFYIDFNDEDDSLIYYLIMSTVIIGGCGMIIGLLYTCIASTGGGSLEIGDGMGAHVLVSQSEEESDDEEDNVAI